MHLLRLTFAALPLFGLLTGCQRQATEQIDYNMGERVNIGPLTYQVVESTWETQLGQMFQVRVPQNRFLLLTLSVTNGGGSPVSIPLLSLEDPNGELLTETADGTGVTNWMGLIRTVNPAQTLQGKLVFDAPLTSFRLRLPDVSETGYDRYAWVKIPLQIDIDELQPKVQGVN